MSENNEKIIRVGSRKSELALIQTKYVISCLQKLNPDKKFEIHTMTTVGDRVLNKSLPKIGEKSLFTKDLEDALRNGGVDFVVHSLKDLPTALPIGMAIGAVLEREDPRDALVLNAKFRGKTLKTLPKGSVIGTSSLRRSAQLARSYPDLIVSDVRGNLNTRLAKLDADNSKFSGLILAHAGLIRMGWQKRVDAVLEPSDILYAIGQGALAVECRSNDDNILEMLSSLAHIDTQYKIVAERSFLKTLGGGCSAPVAVCTNINKQNNNNYHLDITGAVYSLDGKTKIELDKYCILDFEENLNGIHIHPLKRRKLTNNNDDELNDNSIDSNENSLSPPLRKSPDIIDDSAASCSKLVNIHDGVFKKCPYLMQHQQDKINTSKNSNEDQIDGCPLKIPIGQDFMGQCPYFNTKQKVELDLIIGTNDIMGKCPLSQQNKLTIKKCPVTGKISSTDSNKNLTTEQCPYFSKQNQFKLIDYDQNVKTELPHIIDNTESLFCGLYKHKNAKYDLLRKCEELGIELAEHLIRNGALDVMKLAQQEIRGEKS